MATMSKHLEPIGIDGDTKISIVVDNKNMRSVISLTHPYEFDMSYPDMVLNGVPIAVKGSIEDVVQVTPNKFNPGDSVRIAGRARKTNSRYVVAGYARNFDGSQKNPKQVIMGVHVRGNDIASYYMTELEHKLVHSPSHPILRKSKLAIFNEELAKIGISSQAPLLSKDQATTAMVAAAKRIENGESNGKDY